METRYSPPDLPKLTKIIGLVLALVVCASLLLRFSAAAIWDDAWFYTRYAEQYLSTGTYRWNPYGEPSYGLTAPLFGLQVLLFQAIGLPPGLSLWLLAAFWGILGFWILYRLIPIHADDTGRSRPYLQLFLWLTAAINLPWLAVHFTSGMDTSFAITFMAGYLLLAQLFTPHLSPGKALALGIYGSLAWTIRPDLAVFVLAVPLGLVFFSEKALQRREAAYTLLFTLFGILFQVWMALQEFGTLLPLSFYAKSINPYGPAIASAYRWTGFAQWFHFAALNIIPFSILLFAWIKGGRVWWRFLGIVERMLLIAWLIFTAYHLFLVIPVMGYAARFHYPAWPVLLWLAAKSWVFLLRSRPQLSQRLYPLPGTWPRKILFGILLLAYAATATWLIRPPETRTAWAHLDPLTAYQVLGRNNWPYLDEISRLPHALSIASTEVGILGALDARRRIVDLSGLHDPEAVRHGFDPKRLLHTQKPDLIYMPHPDYAEMNQALLDHPDFNRLYLHYPATTLQSFQGIALRRDSHWFPALKAIIQPQ